MQTGPEEDYYHAAVVEYSPLDGKDGEEILHKNGEEFIRHIKEAANMVSQSKELRNFR